jgi:hypothetical protein
MPLVEQELATLPEHPSPPLCHLFVKKRFGDDIGVIRSLNSKEKQYNDLQNTENSRLSNVNPTKNQRWTRVLRKSGQFLLH